jgi:hypothetical protein
VSDGDQQGSRGVFLLKGSDHFLQLSDVADEHAVALANLTAAEQRRPNFLQ